MKTQSANASTFMGTLGSRNRGVVRIQWRTTWRRTAAGGLFASNAKTIRPQHHLVRTSGRPEAVISNVRSQVQQLDSNLALTNVQTIGEVIDQGLGLHAWRALLAVFGGLALILAIIGVYGVLSYSVNSRLAKLESAWPWAPKLARATTGGRAGYASLRARD